MPAQPGIRDSAGKEKRELMARISPKQSGVESREGFTMRPATAADVEHLVHFRRGMYADMGNEDATALEQMQATSRSYFAKALVNGSCKAWIVEADGRVVAGGAIIISPWPSHPGDSSTKKAMILNLYTEHEYRRRGIARRLMEAMIAWCRAEGFRSVALHASTDGRHLYESLGFEPTNEMRLML